MTRTEHDLRGALHELGQRADRHGAPSTATILAGASEIHLDQHQDLRRRTPRWLPPLAAAAAVAAAAITAVTLSGGQSGGAAQGNGQPAGGQSTTARPRSVPMVKRHVPVKRDAPNPATILDAAAAKLDAKSWTTPRPQEFFYVHTTEATYWTSVSGTKPGHIRTNDGTPVPVPSCQDGKIVAPGESGNCTLNDVPHYLADAPTTPAAWDAYLERMAPGAKAADAQGKIIVQSLHDDLAAPQADAALLRYTETCPGLHTIDVRPVDGEQLAGITCTSMTNGSYGLAFDATSHAFAGFVPLSAAGQQTGPAEVVLRTGIVAAVGDQP